MPYTPNPDDTTQPQGSVDASTAAAEFKALKTKIAGLIAGLFTTTATNTNPYGLVNLLHPSGSDKGRSIIASGWDFCGRNQQWGGSPTFYGNFVDSATGAAFDFTSFDGYIEDDGTGTAIGDVAGRFYDYQVITPSKNLSLSEVWFRGYKSGNPVDNLTLKLWSVAAGVPNALIATFNVINGKQITSDTNGQWYRFTLAAVQALVAGTQYVITAEKSAGVDAANFYVWKRKVTTKYPSNLSGSGTNAPVWTALNTTSFMFLAVSQASDQTLQSGGQFDWMLQGYDANPVNRGSALCQDLKNLKWNPKKGTVLIRGASFTKGKPIFDALYGLHHDRLVLYADAASGVGKISLFQQNGTVTTIIGTTDLSTATFKDIAIEYLINGAGADYLRLRVGTGGVAPTVEASVTAQTFVMDPLWGQLGTAWLMGGFDPTFTSASYTKLSDMNVLPSADGWTFTTTTATVEGSVFAISGGKLNQIKAGMAAGGDGYYKIAAPGFVNATGHGAVKKLRCVSNTNTKDATGLIFAIDDGIKRNVIYTQEYFNQVSDTAVYSQQDFKAQDNVVINTLKGPDGYVFVNGKFVMDRTGIVGGTSAPVGISFGDLATAANENADAIVDYVGYLNTGPILPKFSSGSLSEFAYWQEDASAIMAALYNAGAPLSVKTYAGIEKNWIGEYRFEKIVKGVTSSPTTASPTNPIIMAEMEIFIMGGSFLNTISTRTQHSVGSNYIQLGISVDSSSILGSPGDSSAVAFPPAAGNEEEITIADFAKNSYFGLHKVEGRWATQAATGTLTATNRHLTVKGGV